MQEVQNARDLIPFTLVQCFYGLDKARVVAVTKAMQHMLRSDPMPAEWIFVEAQHSKDDAQFTWLENYGAKHMFIKSSQKNEDIPLKSALWNIGANAAKHDNLAFVDADCWFKDFSWAENAAAALEEHDFCSLSKTCVYSEKPDNQLESVGAKWCSIQSSIDQSQNVQFGHCGFTFGAKRAAFNEVGKLSTLPVLEDIYIWSKIFGSRCTYNRRDMLLWNNKSMQMPIRQFNVGYAEGECVHVFHGEYKQRRYYEVLNVAKLMQLEPFQGIAVANKLPCWDSTKCGRFMKEFMHAVKDPAVATVKAIDIALEEIS